MYWASGFGQESVVRLLLKNGAKIDSADSKGWTPLWAACQTGQDATVRILLEKGASVNHADNDGCTPLYIACSKGHESTARLLLDNGASVNQVENFGKTPMLYACHFKHEAVARLLARRGATITKQVVDEAKAQGKRKLAKWLRRVYGHATSLHWACEDRDREGLLRRLRSDEYERALPPLAELEAIATHKHAPACERSVRLLRLAHEPWDVLRRHVWPRSFREHIAAVTDVTRDRGGEVICFAILAFCGRDWWAGHGAIEGEARVPGPIGAGLVLSRHICDECQQCPMERARELKRCSGCRAVYYCTRRGMDGKAVCQHKAWSGHKKACKKATRERKRREAAV